MTFPWVGALCTLAVFFITNLIVSIWWASRVTTLLDILQRDFSVVVAELKGMRSFYVTKEEHAYQTALWEKETSALWKRFDELPCRHRDDPHAA